MELLVLLLIVIVPVGIYINVYNTIQRYKIKIEESFANIDVALAKRYEVLTKLMDVAKGYAKHEKETILAVVQVRQGMSVDEKESAYNAIESGFNQLSFLSESYPELKADKLFLNLQDAVVDTESNLAAARRIYNSNVSYFNQRIETFPGNMIASNMNVQKQSMLKFDSQQLQNPDLGRW